MTGRAGPLLAALSVALTLLALEGIVRLRLSEANRAALPHVGVDAETERRLEWVERGRAARGAEAWQLDIPDPVLGWRPRPGISTRSVRPGSYDVTVTTNAQGLRGRRPARTAHGRLPTTSASTTRRRTQADALSCCCFAVRRSARRSWAVR